MDPRPAPGEPPRPKKPAAVRSCSIVCVWRRGGRNRAAKRDRIPTQRPRCHSPGLNPSTRRRDCEKSARPRTLPTPPTLSHPEIRVKNMVKMPTGAAGDTRTRRPRPSAEAGPNRSHTRHSPVSWRQTRCEKERSRGLRHLYTVLPHPRGKGRSQHTTPLSQFTPRRLHQAPVQSPSPPPTSRGPWAMYAQPTDERWAPRACSSRPRGGRERVGGGRGRALPRFQSSGSLSTVPGLPPAEESPPFV